DSTTCLAIAKAQGFSPLLTMAFDYGQRHRQELAAAKKISDIFGAQEHRILQLDLRQFGGSALTADMAVPKNRDESQMSAEIPITYVPARNTIFLSYALAWAEVAQCDDVFIGVNALDYSGYPDCRPQFIESFQHTARLGTKRSNFTIHAPLIHLSKSQIIQLGVEIGVDYSLTHSCYDPSPQGLACGRCDSCLLRKKGFAEAHVPDPTVYIG
ncbi:MAG TPA: 7-cyano-7-deazaguanine synthase QueC, partial [Tepidisphaeraceae bacterium]